MQFILNADDFGRTETANEAIVYGFRNGYVSRTTVMVNMPCYEDAKALAREYGFYDKVGLHINIVSGEPLTEDIKVCPSFIGEGGRFNGVIFQRRRLWFFLSRKEKAALTKEIRAQIERYLADGFSLLHADSHGHTHTFPAINKIVLRLLREYGFRSVRFARSFGEGFLKKCYKRIFGRAGRRFNRAGEAAVQHFGSFDDVVKYWDEIKGCCEIMLHPNVYSGSIRAEWNFSFETVTAFLWDRGGVIIEG